jgi:cell division protein ZapD
VEPVQEAVDLLLALIRNSATARPEHAIAGFYQRTLSGSTQAQLVRVALPAGSPLFAEISGSKHRFSIRFLECSDIEHPSQTADDVAFMLTTCSL